MIVRKNLKWSKILKLSFGRLIYFLSVAVGVYVLHEILDFAYVTIPFAIVATLASALAIFLAFRNSSSYDRWWEARKIWGEIVNSSRTWGRQVITFMDGADDGFQRSLVYKQLAWINALRLQLREQENWEVLDPFIKSEEKADLITQQNKATQLNLRQGEAIQEALKNGWISDFRHQLLDKTLTDLIACQGKCERIKNTPMARQYDYFTRFFVIVFATLLPFGMIDLLDAKHIAWVVIPLSVLISFVFSVLESVGAYNEDPFENREQDTPMTALCNTIEIDLREQLGEKEIPQKLGPVDGILW